MKRRRNIFDWAFLVSLIAFLILLLIAVGLLIAEYALNIEGPSPLAPLIAGIVLIMATCILILWIEAWVWLLEDWKGRGIEMNLALIAFIIIGPVFAAYIIHFLRAKGQIQRGRRFKGIGH
jgi:hypothetical protein